MGAENLTALEEIKALGRQVDSAGEADVETLRQRLDWIVSMCPGDPGGAEGCRRGYAAAGEAVRRSSSLSSSATTVPGGRPNPDLPLYLPRDRLRTTDHSSRAANHSARA